MKPEIDCCKLPKKSPEKDREEIQEATVDLAGVLDCIFALKEEQGTALLQTFFGMSFVKYCGASWLDMGW